MERKTLGFISAVLFGFLASSPASYATDDLYSLYPVGGSGNAVEKNVFTFDERPFLYVHLPESRLNFVSSFWNAPNGDFHFASHGPSVDQDIWLTLSNWETARALGTWNVNAGYLFAEGDSEGACKGSCGAGQTSFTVTESPFTVTPEPMSTSLFIVGGLTLAAMTRRKKNILEV